MIPRCRTPGRLGPIGRLLEREVPRQYLLHGGRMRRPVAHRSVRPHPEPVDTTCLATTVAGPGAHAHPRGWALPPRLECGSPPPPPERSVGQHRAVPCVITRRNRVPFPRTVEPLPRGSRNHSLNVFFRLLWVAVSGHGVASLPRPVRRRSARRSAVEHCRSYSPEPRRHHRRRGVSDLSPTCRRGADRN